MQTALQSQYVRYVPPMRPASTQTQTALAALTLSVLVGTGGHLNLAHIDRWEDAIKGRAALEISGERQRPSTDMRSPAMHIENIRDVLAPSMSELGAVFDVSRQSVYKWASGEALPEPPKLEKVVALSHVADALRNAGASNPGTLIKMKAFGGRSLLDLVRDGHQLTTQVHFLIDESQAMDAAYARSGLAESKSKPGDHWKSTLSVPGGIESA